MPVTDDPDLVAAADVAGDDAPFMQTSMMHLPGTMDTDNTRAKTEANSTQGKTMTVQSLTCLRAFSLMTKPFLGRTMKRALPLKGSPVMGQQNSASLATASPCAAVWTAAELLRHSCRSVMCFRLDM